MESNQLHFLHHVANQLRFSTNQLYFLHLIRFVKPVSRSETVWTNHSRPYHKFRKAKPLDNNRPVLPAVRRTIFAPAKPYGRTKEPPASPYEPIITDLPPQSHQSRRSKNPGVQRAESLWTPPPRRGGGLRGWGESHRGWESLSPAGELSVWDESLSPTENYRFGMNPPPEGEISVQDETPRR